MAGTLSRSWTITKLSFGVIKQDKVLLLFPLFSGIFSVLFLAALILPTFRMFIVEEGEAEMTAVQYAIMFVIYLGLAFIATFFNVCTVYTAKRRLYSENVSLTQSLGFACSRIHLIFMWSLLAATVGVLLRILDNAAQKLGTVGKIIMGMVTSVLGMAWGVVTIFVVPGMVFENLGPIDAIRKSVEVLKKTWGESLARHFGMGLIQGLILILLMLISMPLLFWAGTRFGSTALVVAAVAMAALFVLTILVFSAANSVYNTALYVYASSGQVAEGFNREALEDAFTPKK